MLVRRSIVFQFECRVTMASKVLVKNLLTIIV